LHVHIYIYIYITSFIVVQTKASPEITIKPNLAKTPLSHSTFLRTDRSTLTCTKKKSLGVPSISARDFSQIPAPLPYFVTQAVGAIARMLDKQAHCITGIAAV